jgi:hypothetical protein
MAWPNMHDVDSYCDYNNGLFEHKAMMIPDWCADPSLKQRFPQLEDYAKFLNEEFDQLFWANKYKQINEPIHYFGIVEKQLPPMSEFDKEVVTQLLG